MNWTPIRAYGVLMSIISSLIAIRYSQHLTAKLLKNTQLNQTAMSQLATVSYVTAPNIDIARKLSRGLIEMRLAACVNIIPSIESIYEWDGKLEQDNELLLIIKSHSSKSDQLTDYVEQHHPYDTPEVVTVKIESGSSKYLDWVEKTIKKSPM